MNHKARVWPHRPDRMTASEWLWEIWKAERDPELRELARIRRDAERQAKQPQQVAA